MHLSTKFSTFLSLFICFIGLSCSKEPDYSMVIQIVEYGTNKPIVGAKVAVRKFDLLPGTWDGSVTTYDTVITDNGGYADLDGSEYDPYEFEVYSKDNNYHDAYQSKSYGTKLIDPRFRENPIFSLFPNAWIKLQVTDWDSISKVFYKLNIGTIEASEFHEFRAFSDTIFKTIRIPGNKYHSIPIFGYSSDGTYKSFFNDSIYSPAFDTTSYTIHYP